MPGFMFAEKKNEDTSNTEIKNPLDRWKVLIVDDEKSIHSVTELVLGDFEFNEKRLEFLNAYSATEAKDILKEHHDIALILLDVVMESEHAGLDLVKYIRNVLNNTLIRIVLRTGQPGSAPEEEVINSYDINDYKDKTELTNTKLKSTVHNAIKSYRDIVELYDNANTLLKYKNMFDSATDFIFVVDKESKIIEANSAFLNAIGKSHSDTIGTPLYDIFTFKNRDAELKEKLQESTNGLHVRFSSELLFNNIGKCYVNIESFPYYNEEHDLSAIVINVQDITRDIVQQKETNSLKNNQIENYKQTVQSLVDMIEGRDSFTAGHTNRVAEYTKLIAVEMKLEAEDIQKLYQAAKIHDIGKITTPDSILLKPGKFNELEYELIKEHLNSGYKILKNIDMYSELAEIVVLHHERYDGDGYPNGLKGDDISLLGHIMIVADAFDAMTTNRIYKKRKEISDAFIEMVELKEKQFHPSVVDAALIALKNVDINTDDQLPKSSAEKARFAYFFRDPLTKTYNSDYLDTVLSMEESSFKKAHYVNILNMSSYNRNRGWENGNLLLRTISNSIHKQHPLYLKFRIHGDDFFLLAQDDNPIDIDVINSIPLVKESEIKVSVTSLDITDKSIDTLKELKSYFNI